MDGCHGFTVCDGHWVGEVSWLNLARVSSCVPAFLRYALGIILLLPMVPFRAGLRLQNYQWRLSIWRGILHAVAVVLWFFAMARIPIADVTAMNYMAPIYVTVGAALFLGERLALRRLVAVAIALIVALTILRPDFREIGDGHVAMVFATLFWRLSPDGKTIYRRDASRVGGYFIINICNHRVVAIGGHGLGAAQRA